jgi:hypothetical protein
MADSPNPQQWAELRTNRPIYEDAMVVMPLTAAGAETQLSLAMDQPGNLHLLIPVQRGPSGQRPSDLNGLQVRHRRLEIGEVLDLSAPPSHEQVFTPFCREIVDAVVVQQREPWSAVAACVRAWQSAWKPMRQEMDKSVQIGLFGELPVLNTLMLPSIGAAAVDQWSGPDSERHDFVGDRLHLEVKTTRKSRAEHEISRFDQLRVPDGRRLLFVSIQVEQSIGGAQTLASQVDATINALRVDAGAMDLFMLKMVNMGWTDAMRESGELLRLNVRDSGIYAVDASFPRLLDDFMPPLGVVSIKYTVDLANLPTLGADEAIAIIKVANPTFVL